MNYPKVNEELCIGCGACIYVCPTEAIVINNGLAKIVERNCCNCKACESECPVEAIS